MNNPLNNTLNLQPALNAAPPLSGATTTGPTAGGTGAFAQLLGSLVATPAVPKANDGGDALATIPAPLPEGDAVVTDGVSPAEQTEAAAVMLQPDAALIAALLGQMQTPYAMPPPATPAAAAPSAAAADAVQTHTVNSAPVVADVPLGYTMTAAAATAASTTATPTPQTASAPQQPAARDSEAIAAPFGADLEVQAEPADSQAALITAVARGEPTAEAIAAVVPKALPASPPLSLAPATAVATAPVTGAQTAMPNTTARPTDGAASTNEDRPQPSRASVVREDNPAPTTHARALDGLRQGLQAQSAEYTQESPATPSTMSAVTTVSNIPLAVPHAAARPPFGAPGQRDDRITDATTIPTAAPATVAAHSGVPASAVSIAPRFASPEWQPAFAQGVKLLVNDGLSTATLQLNPAEFGPIDVRIVISEQRADISFMVGHPEANAAIQSSLSELRDQLARSGIQLGQTSVGAHPQHPQQSGDTPRRETATAPAPEHSPATPIPAATRSVGSGRVDIYA